jgi:phage-related protein
MSSERVIYQGQHFTVEWYYDQKGKSQPYDYFKLTSKAQKRKFLTLAKRIAEFGKILDTTKFRNEGNGLYAFKPKPDRFLSFFVKGKKIIVVHAFCKKSDKMPTKEKTTAIRRMKDYLERQP